MDVTVHTHKHCAKPLLDHGWVIIFRKGTMLSRSQLLSANVRKVCNNNLHHQTPQDFYLLDEESAGVILPEASSGGSERKPAARAAKSGQAYSQAHLRDRGHQEARSLFVRNAARRDVPVFNWFGAEYGHRGRQITVREGPYWTPRSLPTANDNPSTHSHYSIARSVARSFLGCEHSLWYFLKNYNLPFC